MEKTSQWMVRVQCILLLALPVIIATHKFSLLHFSQVSPLLSAAMMGMLLLGMLALIVLVFGLVKQATQFVRRAAVTVLLAAAPVIFMVAIVGAESFTVPAIHDISTDVDSPPVFVAAAQDRHANDNSADYGGEGVANLQLKFYPLIEPLVLDVSMSEAYERVSKAVASSGWQVLRADDVAREIEAVAQTQWFGYKDDIIVRVSSTPQGARIDVRSASRVGVSDLGANAKRILNFLSKIEQ